MSFFGQNFLKAIDPNFGDNLKSGFLGDTILRDYTHASKTFTTNAYELKPRYKFLFHVSFTLNTDQIPFLRGAFGNDDQANLSLAVKTIDLPKYNIEIETLENYIAYHSTVSDEDIINLISEDDLKELNFDLDISKSEIEAILNTNSNLDNYLID